MRTSSHQQEQLEATMAAGITCVIGAGPAGLGTAAELTRRHVPTVVLERGDSVGTSWRAGYDRLRLHTTRRLSGLPGMPIPRSAGRWPGRDAVVAYLESYARDRSIDVRTGVTVVAVTPLGEEDRPDRWAVRTDTGDTVRAATVVVATGYNRVPVLPDWPGVTSFPGVLEHAARYRSASPFRGRDVLVVGMGNSGAEIATDLAEGGARHVWIAVRTPPHIVRRATWGIPSQGIGLLVQRLPTPAIDVLAALLRRLSVPDLRSSGLGLPPDGVGERLRRDGSVPLQDVGIVRVIRSGAVEPVAAVTSFDGAVVHLADGRSLRPDAVVAATGYRPGLADLVGPLDVLDDRGLPRVHDGEPVLPGLHFVGYRFALGGALREIAAGARRVARAVARDRARGARPRAA